MPNNGILKDYHPIDILLREFIYIFLRQLQTLFNKHNMRNVKNYRPMFLIIPRKKKLYLLLIVLLNIHPVLLSKIRIKKVQCLFVQSFCGRRVVMLEGKTHTHFFSSIASL